MLYYSISVKTYKVQLLPDFVALVIWNFGGVVDIFNRHFADRFWRNSEWNKATQNRSMYVANRKSLSQRLGRKSNYKICGFYFDWSKGKRGQFLIGQKNTPQFLSVFFFVAGNACLYLTVTTLTGYLKHLTFLTLFAPVLHCKSHRSTIQSYTEM